MSGERIRRFLDSCVFIAVIKGEQDRAERVLPILKAAEAGKTEVVISPIVQAEVVKTEDQQYPRTAEQEERLRAYFEHEWLLMQPVSANAGRMAQKFRWRYRLGTADALHLACAIEAGAHVLETFDEERFIQRVVGAPIELRLPRWEGQSAIPGLGEDRTDR